MILDDYLELADAQTSTANSASTSTIDTVAGGDSYEGAFFLVRVDTTFTAYGAGSPTATFQLQTSDDEDFGGVAVTLVQSAALTPAKLLTGKYWAARIPAGALRYIRGYISTTLIPNVFATASYDMYICRDIDTANNDRDLIV